MERDINNESRHQEYMSVLHVYSPSKRIGVYAEQKLIALKEKTDSQI